MECLGESGRPDADLADADLVTESIDSLVYRRSQDLTTEGLELLARGGVSEVVSKKSKRGTGTRTRLGVDG
jgi:hypothetical protein